MNVTETLRNQAREARRSAQQLAQVSTELKNEVLQAIASTLRANVAPLLEANAKDVAVAQELRERGELSGSAAARVALSEGKIEQMAQSVEQVGALPDPVGQVQMARQLDQGLNLYRVSCPIGVILVIFESRPDVVTQISALALKSGNAVILKGGKEAQHTNRLLASLIHEILEASPHVPTEAVSLIESRDEVSQMVRMSDELDLIIPRGSNQLVQYIQENAQVPVMGHADGICHVYLDRDADATKAFEIVVDSKTDYPAVCNAMETLLVHEQFPDSALVSLLQELQARGVELRCCPLTRQRLASSELQLQAATEEDWATEYTDLILSIKTVASGDAAVAHIHQYGSAHTDAIVTESAETAKWFMETVDSAGVFWNASTRFADGFRYGFGAEVGVSTARTHARGPVGLEGLVIYKYRLYGQGHTVGPYSQGTRHFQFENLAPELPSRNS